MRSLLSLGKYWAIEPDTFNNLEALVSKDAPVLENTRTVRIQNGVAVQRSYYRQDGLFDLCSRWDGA